MQLASAAERAFASDPNTTLIKLRQLGEAIAQHIAALVGVEFDEQTTQAKHTSDIFAKPVYTYSCREAVADVAGPLRR